MPAFKQLIGAVVVTLSACVDGALPLGAEVREERGSAAAAKAGHHCFTPWGVDLNESLGIDDAIVDPDCTEIAAGEHFIPLAFWFTNQAGGTEDTPLTYPAGYTPSTAAPMDDFLAKLVSIRYVARPTQRTASYQGTSALIFVPVEAIWGGSGFFPDSWMGFTTAVFVPRLAPMPPGDYEIDLYFTLSAEHCDGLGDVPEENCMPAGELLWWTFAVTITPGPQSLTRGSAIP